MDKASALIATAGEVDSGGMLDGLLKNLPVLLVNGATLLIVVIILLRVLARVIDRTGGDVTRAAHHITEEIGELRKDIRELGDKTAGALGHLTERVSRIEGKIEGIALRADMTDDDRTPVGGIPRPPSHSEQDNVYVNMDDVTPVSNPSRRTPATGIAKIPAVSTTYGMSKPPRKT